jgi:lantibiotic transport system permease protein
MNSFINCYKSEWIKKRRSFGDWLVWLGAFFIPVIHTILFLVYPGQLKKLHAAPDFWRNIFIKSWQPMSFMLLPMGIVLAVSLVTQIEFKNNTWKQLHTAPVPFTSIFFSKLAVLLTMLLQLIILFNIGIGLSAVIPALLNKSIMFPSYPVPVADIAISNGKYFIMCLPILALQYLVSLQFKNFLIPIGAGIALVIGGMIAFSWEYIYTIPTAYTALFHLQNTMKGPAQQNLLLWSGLYTTLFIVMGYILYLFKKEKG